MLYIIVFSVILGALAGNLGFGHHLPLRETSDFIISTLKNLAIPLLFFSIIDAFSKTQISWHKALRMIGLSALNGLVAGLICIILSALFPPSPIATAQPSHFESFRPITHPQDWNSWLHPHPLQVACLAITLGYMIHHTPRLRPLSRLVKQALKVTSSLLRGIILLVPLAIFCTITHLITTVGSDTWSSLGSFLIVVMLGLFTQVFIYYPILLRVYSGIDPLKFFEQAREALITALSTGSSLATLPVTLETMQSKMNINSETSRYVACIGTNLNHTGIFLYEVSAALWIAGSYGLSMDWTQKLKLFATAATAAVGIVGVPEAGLITLSLVLSSTKLPLDLLPLLLGVDWMLGRLRATTNVASDLVVASLLDQAPLQPLAQTND